MNIHSAFLKALLFVIFYSASNSSYAQEMPVPTKVQAVIFAKIFKFDQTLIDKGSFDVLIIYSDASVKDDVAKAFKENGISVSDVNATDFSGKASGASVAYVCPGVKVDKTLFSKNSILSITGLPSLVENGDVAIGIDLQNKKPKIIVNLKQLKSENHDISANLLKLAKIIK